jgi:hypothetical protein
MQGIREGDDEHVGARAQHILADGELMRHECRTRCAERLAIERKASHSVDTRQA